ncbi:carbamoyl-phosphate synthase subunit L [Diaporthe helianthi]|uniref:Carbamoyl-phosphate synthase subunit L n=1 Tax=Diaporthe helianthi TaxID=158607 RepID=A0A2P5I7C4_DIAHE|nr:carbamoyl-phosphate synthase subunit L [Diaporthe helianthi]
MTRITVSNREGTNDPGGIPISPNLEVSKPRELFVASLTQFGDGATEIRKLLIANRGEIACRIIETCKELGVASVAIYVSEDSASRHVTEADESKCIGSIRSTSKNPFLDIDLIIQTALATGAQAIHPGYGYLSENAAFADRTREAGLIFVGPTGASISALGDKRLAKEYLKEHAPDVPLIPGFLGRSQDPEDLIKAAVEIGFPVMLKAAAGGGGKGMRVVHDSKQLRGELESAKSEAQQSFGSSDCILEKFIENSKHIEIQIMGDRHGEVVSFLERDCSVQRRNQKIIEETPCLFLTAELRAQISQTAVRIVKLLGYEGAGTVEFVFDMATMKFYFLEVNTRLQVEHPITEEVTGVDLVALQLFVASGGRLGDLPQLRNLKQTGHAIECRLCAEDPRRGFLPAHGDVLVWRPGQPGRSPRSVVRYETAMRSPCTVSIFFDSMICKIVVWAPTRSEAIDRMARELASMACVGVKTNQLFLQSCLLHKAFQDLRYTTSLIPLNLPDLLKSPHGQSLPAYVPLIPSIYLERLRQLNQPRGSAFRGVRPRFHNQRFDPWSSSAEILSTGNSVSCVTRPPEEPESASQEFHIYQVQTEDTDTGPSEPGSTPPTELHKQISQAVRSGSISEQPPHIVTMVSLKALGDKATAGDAVALEATIDGKRVTAFLALRPTQKNSVEAGDGDHVLLHMPEIGEWLEFHRQTLLSFCSSQRRGAERGQMKDQTEVKAPMPCKILSILKSPGDQVNKGEKVIVIESMKMEMSIYVDGAGKFSTRWKEGDAVDEGSVLCSVNPESST